MFKQGGKLDINFQVNDISLTNDYLILGYDGAVATANNLYAGGLKHQSTNSG